jgi:hypothetical protein
MNRPHRYCSRSMKKYPDQGVVPGAGVTCPKIIPDLDKGLFGLK